MKRHYLLTEILVFLFIFLGLIAPPIFFQFNNSLDFAFSKWDFPYPSVFSFIIAVLIFYFFEDKKSYKNILVKIILPSTFIFCILFFFSLIVKVFSIIIPNCLDSKNIVVQLPAKFLEWFYCILQFGCAAFYEETVYRFYLPESLNNWSDKRKHKKVFKILSEIFVLLLFASAHLYMGIFAFINACFAHVVLRLSFYKCKNIIPLTIAHFLYNIISLILL